MGIKKKQQVHVAARYEMFCRIFVCELQIQARKHVPDVRYAGRTASTRQQELDHGIQIFLKYLDRQVGFDDLSDAKVCCAPRDGRRSEGITKYSASLGGAVSTVYMTRPTIEVKKIYRFSANFFF